MREILFQPNLGCGICYEGVNQATSAASMHCCHHTHIVHHRCALQWYVKQRQQNQPCTCPFCRQVIFTPAQFDQIYTCQDGAIKDSESESDSFDSVYADGDAPAPYTNFHIVQMTYFSYVFMCVNFVFIFIILIKIISWSATKGSFDKNLSQTTKISTLLNVGGLVVWDDQLHP